GGDGQIPAGGGDIEIPPAAGAQAATGDRRAVAAELEQPAAGDAQRPALRDGDGGGRGVEQEGLDGRSAGRVGRSGEADVGAGAEGRAVAGDRDDTERGVVLGEVGAVERDPSAQEAVAYPDQE